WSGSWRYARSGPGRRCGIFCRPCTWASLLLTGPRCTSARRRPVSRPRSFRLSRSTRPLRSCGSTPTTPKPRSYTAYLPETAETCITRGLVRLCVYYRLSNLGMRDGNHQNSGVNAQTGGRFEPTYEGWKPIWQDSAGLGPVGFEPTYEGWKLLARTAEAH